MGAGGNERTKLPEGSCIHIFTGAAAPSDPPLPEVVVMVGTCPTRRAPCPTSRSAGVAARNNDASRSLCASVEARNRSMEATVSLHPLVDPAAALAREGIRRCSRHLIIPDVGVTGQKRLKNARVLCVGAGGLGSPALMYLAEAGARTLGTAESDHAIRLQPPRQH